MGEPAVPTLVYLVTDTTGRAMEQFLADRRRLCAWLPPGRSWPWSKPHRPPRSEVAFERHLWRPALTVTASQHDLRRFFQMRQTVDRVRPGRPVGGGDRPLARCARRSAGRS